VTPTLEDAAPRRAGTAEPAPSPASTISLTPIVAVGWLIFTFLLLTRLAVANARVSAWQRSAMPVQDLRWLALLARLTRQYDIRRPVVLLESDATDVPVTWGVVYPVILVPSNDAWDEEQRAAVLTHELAHVKRFDALTQQLAQVALALLWFHPLVWVAVRRMRLEREHACDDFVLASGARASRYADELLGLARRLSRPTAPAAAALAMARRSELEGRLLAILDPGVRRSAVRRARVAVLAALVLALAMPLAAFAPGADVDTLPEPVIAMDPAEMIAARVADEPPAAPIATPRPGISTASAPAAAPLALLESASKLPAMLTPIREENAQRLIMDLRAVADTEPQRPIDLQTLIDVTRHLKRMTSDHDKGLLLQQIARRYVKSDELRDAYLDAVGSMTSDHERTKALLGLLDRDSLDASSTARVLRTAGTMTSDMNRSIVLKRLTPATFSDTIVQKAYIGVLNGMTSNVERAGAIGTMVKQPNLSQANRLALLRATSGITSNTDKANVLLLFFEQQGLADPVVRSAFYKTAESLTSDSDYRRVMATLLR
jgi:beta-lactamase regulating signal transducer with metallopeptidase domain